ncbi:MAG: UDP-N-acetylmuramate dehydrogenase [Lachnospiraceae bacterium]|nr:UDP-N-acetylmuramate dehydrogenase [Lachnospiraceae bacterium]
MLTAEELKKAAPGADIRTNEPMSEHTTFRVGGPARVFAMPSCEAEVEALVRLCRMEDEPYAVIGRGSNLLVSDEGYSGVVICIGDLFSRIIINKDGIEAEAGAGLVAVSAAARRASFTGLEFACGIPGSLGGAIAMNAGAYGGEMKGVVRSVRVLDREGFVRTLSCGEMNFRYRGSRVMDEDLIVLSASLDLSHGNSREIELRMNELLTARREKQPLEYPSAGSTFKRPEGYFAGALIEQAGLKGFAVGGAQVSGKHAGFVINRGGATASDIMELCRIVQDRVYEDSGVRLEMEVRTLGEFDR